MNTLDIQDGMFVLSCPPRERDFAKQVPGLKYKPKLDAYTGPANWTVALVIQGVFGSRELQVTPAVGTWIALESERIQQLLGFKQSHTDHNIIVEAANGDRLFPWQATDALAASIMESVIDDSVTGSGKGPKYLGAVRILESSGRNVYPLLWVTRPMALFQMEEEAYKWLPGKTVQVVTKGLTPTARTKAIESGADVLIVPWHLLALHSRLAPYGSQRLTPAQKAPKELNGRFNSMIFDEAHKALDPSTHVAKAMWALADEVKYKFFLTNTPMERAPDELWTLQRAARPEHFPSSVRYKERYCQMAPQFFGPDKCIGLNPATEQEWRSIWETMSISRGEEVLGDLPPKHYEMFETDMEGKQRSTYSTFAKNGVVKQGELVLTATNPLVKKLRLLQMACATPVLGLETVKDPETGERVERVTVESYKMPSCKVDFLMEVLDKYRDPLVVFMDDRKLLNLCAEALAKAQVSYVEFKGGMKDKVREAGRHEFQSGNVRVALCMFQCAAEGLTFTAASRILYLQRDDSSIHSEQSEGRTRRIGQTAEVCEYIDHITKDSEELSVHQNYLSKIKARNDALGRTTEVRELSA